MNVFRRKFAIPLTFLCALAQGMWIGAGWHARSAAEKSAENCRCAIAFEAITRRTVSHPAEVIVAAPETNCAVCELGTLAPDVPTIFMLSPVDPVRIEDSAAVFLKLDCQFACVLPPGRAPPSI